MQKKAMLGHKIRQLRNEMNLTQADMAERLDISASYLNLMEHNQRPVTVPVLLKLGQEFAIDLQSFAEDDAERLVGDLDEMFQDGFFTDYNIGLQEMKQLAHNSPNAAQAMMALYGQYRNAIEDLQIAASRAENENPEELGNRNNLPLDEVRDWFQHQQNHFEEIEEAADLFRERANIDPQESYSGLRDFLQEQLGYRLRIMPADVLSNASRRLDRHARALFLSEMLPPSSRNFQIAYQIALLDRAPLLDRMVGEAGLSGHRAQKLLRIGLANYFAGAVLMPYDPFLKAAKDSRYDLALLQHRFHASFEQVAHRLTTLQRSGDRGIPFFLMKVDNAGNISKRFSAIPKFHFARFGGSCPRWNVHDAFTRPGEVHTMFATMTDAKSYFMLASTTESQGARFGASRRRLAIGLGCEASRAGELVYADGLDLDNKDIATPIGVACRLCERNDCRQRAHPPIHMPTALDENLRGPSGYVVG